MGSRNYISEKGIPKLLSDLEDLLTDTQNADAVFYIGPKETQIACHSFILKYRCKSYRVDPKNMKMRHPELNPELFQTFLQYLYTGKLSVEENSVFELFCIASEFGMDDLEITCEELLCNNLESNSAATLLSAALNAKKKHRHSGKGLQRLINRCVCYIGENPTDCLQNSTSLSLPSETLIEIISSDSLCLEEEEVWRFVLRWAQYQSDVPSHVSRWTEDERKKVAKYLSPIISHVRLLLIDSRIFAEEIEPTGCVPMALSLERYRFAALPHQFCFGETDPRLTPRNTPRLFQSSVIINNDRVSLGRKLNEWYGGPTKQTWRCVYRASSHGFSADAFHEHCDGRAPTYTIILIQNTKWICGGFTDIPWRGSQSPKYSSSNRSFLFCYDGRTSSQNSRLQPIKFKVIKKQYAVCHDSQSGPIFGAGADLSISSNSNTNAESYSNLHSYENVEGGIDNTRDSSLLTPSYNFTVSDYEVFVPMDSNNE